MRSVINRLTQQEDLNFLLTNGIPRHLATRFMGWFTHIEQPLVRDLSIATWRFFAEVDLILTPTAAALPWPAATPYPDTIDGRPAGPRDHAIFTGWVNIAGVPAISLPVGMSRSALPIGAQLAAGFAADDFLLAFASDVERAVPATLLPQMETAP